MKFFFHRWLNFSFDSFLSIFNTCIQLQNVNEIFESTIMKVFQKKKILTRFLIKIFSSEMYFTNQRSNLYRKWRKWLHEVNTKEEMNENLKTYISKENREKNQSNKADYKNKTRKLWKWIIIGGNFFIISRIMNWVTSQFLNINFKSGSRTPALSKVEFIVTVAAITMFLFKLVFLLSHSNLINIAHSLKRFGKSLKSNCDEELCFSLDFSSNR